MWKIVQPLLQKNKQFRVMEIILMQVGCDFQVPLVFQSTRPAVEVGLLWIEMLRFYSLEFIMADNVISVRTNAVLSREMKDWPKKRIAIEGQKLFVKSIAYCFL